MTAKYVKDELCGLRKNASLKAVAQATRSQAVAYKRRYRHYVMSSNEARNAGNLTAMRILQAEASECFCLYTDFVQLSKHLHRLAGLECVEIVEV